MDAAGAQRRKAAEERPGTAVRGRNARPALLQAGFRGAWPVVADRRLPITGLSARLLFLTIFFVMLIEVFIYAPSISRYRLAYLEDRIGAAYIASLALQAPADRRVDPELMKELLRSSQSYAIVLRRPDSKTLMQIRDDMPPEVDATYDVREMDSLAPIAEALAVLRRDEPRMIRVVGPSPRDPDTVIETVISERPMREDMLDYSGRILLLSVIISVLTAVLVYGCLQWMFVRPVRNLTDSMVNFRRDPDDASRLIRPTGRRDEIGSAQRELAQMQQRIRDALGQRARLAALGAAVAKINHDLRNILATARLVSDRVSGSADPEVRRVAPTLFGAIDRAVTLCSRTLSFASEGSPPPEPRRFDLRALVREVAVDLAAGENRKVENAVPREFDVFADRDQLYRVLFNLVLNAFQAGAVAVAVSATTDGETATVEVDDDGPGVSAKARENLFRPFRGAARAGGTGLGLAIARDLMRGHGGDIELSRTGADGSVFMLRLPVGARCASSPESRLSRRS